MKGLERETPPLVATDRDGTLLDYATRRVPEGFGEVLEHVLAAGATVAVASGRTPHGTIPAEATSILSKIGNLT